MIIDKIENIDLYKKLGPGFRKAFNYIEKLDVSKLKPGKQIIEQDHVFAIISSYATKKSKECITEAHLKYADLHLVYEGKEKIGYTEDKNQKALKEYDSIGDYMTFGFQNDISYFLLNKNRFSIFFPGELHVPGISIKESAIVKKIVIKILINKA